MKIVILEQKLNSIRPKFIDGHEKYLEKKREITTELSEMLNDEVQVSLSWNGRRMVHIEGYKGRVEVDKLVSLFFRSPVFSGEGYRETYFPNSFQDRVRCLNLWPKLKELYTKTDRLIEKTRSCRSFVVHLFNRFRNSHLRHRIMNEEGVYPEKMRPRVFTENEFKTQWPQAQPKCKVLESIVIEGFGGTPTVYYNILDELPKVVRKSEHIIGNDYYHVVSEETLRQAQQKKKQL